MREISGGEEMARKGSLVLALLCVVALGSAVAVDLNVIGFKVGPDEIGLPMDKAHQWLISNFTAKNPGVKVNTLEAPPDFDTQLYVDLAAGTGPDLWYADASTLARLGDSGYLLDMRDMAKYVPGFTFDRFWPTVLDIHKGKKGEYWGIPSDFTPMVIYYNPEVFAKAKVKVPTTTWTWDDLVKAAQLTTLDSQGRNRLDKNFDEKNVVTWGYRQRQYTFEWIYRVWENGGDVIAPDGTTVSGYLDSAATMEALQFMQDLILKYKVAPQPSALDQLNQGMGFNDRFLQGKAAMFDRGHWELVGLRGSKNFNGKNVAVAVQPKKKNNLTVIYESGFVINKNAKGDVLTANLAIPGNKKAAEKSATLVQYPDIEKAFLDQVPNSRLPYGSRWVKWPAIETILDGMMDKIIHGTDVKTAVAAAVTECNRELGK
jgi:multiple sugar transport system substrate-binding protein